MSVLTAAGGVRRLRRWHCYAAPLTQPAAVRQQRGALLRPALMRAR